MEDFIKNFIKHSQENWQGTVIGIVLVLVIFAFTSQSTSKPNKVIGKKKRVQGAIDISDYANFVLTADEVSKHNKEGDAWLIVEDRVFDVTSYLEYHPGGDSMVKWFGKNATKAFKGDQHPSSAADVIEEYYIGKLVQ